MERIGKTIATDILLSRPKGEFPHRYEVPAGLDSLWKEYVEGHPLLQGYLEKEDTARKTIETAMGKIREHLREITALAVEGLRKIPGVVIYGPLDAEKRGGLVAFTIDNLPAPEVGQQLSNHGIETRWGHHCAYFAHDRYGIKDPGTVRMSFYVYNRPEEVSYAMDVVERISRSAGNR